MRMILAAIAVAPLCLSAQDATARVRVVHDGVAVPLARVGVGPVTRTTDAAGVARFQVGAGRHVFVATKIGFTPDSIAVTLYAGADTTVSISLGRISKDLEGVVVSATRTERRVEDTPVRVEVIDEEEVAEKVAMTPGDIVMMMNETSGLRVAMTSPSLGAANVRIQGLRGRYTLMLMDGLPLAGAQNGFGLLQIPPVDLARVEVIKGTASALYGSSALGGVINLVSRRPSEEPEREVLFNQTSRGGTDAVAYASSPKGASLLMSAHHQRANDFDDDGWTDLAGYERIVVRPRFYLGGERRNMFVTLGATSEDRRGGGLTPLVQPTDPPRQVTHAEGLRTRRFDGGTVGRVALGERGIGSMRASFTSQAHRHRFGNRAEEDNHLTAFSEASATFTHGRMTIVGGAAYQHDEYRNEVVPDVNFVFRAPSAFSQLDVDAASWLVVSGAGRIDWHNVYRTSVNPRVSALVRLPAAEGLKGWTVRASAGTGTFAPTPLTEETEASGMMALRLATSGQIASLVRENASSTSVDLHAPVETAFGNFDVNATAFTSRIRDAVQIRPAQNFDPHGLQDLEILNAPIPVKNAGGEFLARWTYGDARVTASYAYLRATEWNPESPNVVRRDVPLTPRHTAGVVASLEREGVSRIGIEIYYTGAQALTDNPYRIVSEPYVIFGLLAERQFATRAGHMRVFVNAENVGNVRQTDFDPLVLPSPGPGGRWTTDAWTELAGFTLNGGVRLRF